MCFGNMSARKAAERCRLAASLFGAMFAASLAAPASASILITIDKSTQQMSVRGRWRAALRLAGLDRAARL
jgi:hypothetical protein